MEATDLADPIELDAMELLGVQLSPDRQSLRMKLKSGSGKAVTVTLPTGWVNKLLTAVPREVDGGAAQVLDSWELDRVGNGRDLVLTLRTTEGAAVSFTAKSWQLEGMATIATYGGSGALPNKTVH